MTVHFHTDNYWFSGSETTLLTLLADAFQPGRPAAVFTYRAWPEYEQALRGRLDPAVDARALTLPDPAGFKARIIRSGGPAWSTSVRAGSRLLPLRTTCLALDVARFSRLLRAERPSLLHVNNGGFPGAISCNAAAIAAQRAGVPVVYVVNNLAIARPWSRTHDRLVRRSVTRFVTGSRAAAAALAGVLDLDLGDVEVIPNTIVEGVAHETPLETRRRLGLRDDGPVLLTAARLETRKGHRHLIAAVAMLPADVRDRLTVVFAGDGPERASLEQAVAAAGLGETIRLVGNQHNMWNLYALADALVLPSVGFEDFPIVILEAMAAGRAVVGTHIAGIPEQVVDGVTGRVVPPGEPRALAAAIEPLLRSPALSRAMGEAGRARYVDNYTPATVIGRYRALHDRLAARPEVPQWA